MALLSSTASWFPGHMAQFFKHLPALLSQTHVVLEVRDVRLPLTSINPTLETALEKWRKGREMKNGICERIVVYTKQDLIEGGQEPLRKALAKHFHHKTHFNSNGTPKDLRKLHSALVSIAKANEETTQALNVLVVGMPNMGKSTLLNSLRWAGTANSTKAMRTSAQPGLTQKTSERLRLNRNPPIFAVDSPGVMVPFLGKGEEGRDRGFKLALIAGIKESLYDDEVLAGYLLNQLNRLNPEAPAYLTLYPPSVPPKPTNSIEEFLSILSDRLGARLKGGEVDTQRTSKWFIKWWREGGAKSAPMTYGWGFDFDWRVRETDAETGVVNEVLDGASLEEKMERRVAAFAGKMKRAEDDEDGFGVSQTQERRRGQLEKKRIRDERRKIIAAGTHSSR